MRKKITKVLQYYSLWLALLLHLLLLLSFTIIYVNTPTIPLSQRAPSLDIPAYVYRAPSTSSTSLTEKKEKILKDPAGIEKPSPDQTHYIPKPNQMQAIDSNKNQKAIHLIGDDKTSKSLLRLLGIALGEKLVYPKIAEDFRIRGRVLVGFTLQPNGVVTQAKVVQSSKQPTLDAEALTAVQEMSPVAKVDTFIQKPEYIVVGVIFH